MTKEEAKNRLAELVSKYEGLSTSEIKSYHEAKTKQGFVLPLFQYLGWNVFNTDEVAPEEKVSKGRVDYAFKLHGVPQFYLETKPLKADLNNPQFKEQVITYAYNKGVTWAVLTDFEGVQVFNAQTGQRFLNLNYKDYVTDFGKLWLLSRTSLLDGLLNKEAAQYGALPPSLPIEKRLFQQFREWRERLSRQLRAYHRELGWQWIDEIILRLLSRLIFIRTCEDRELEGKELLAILNQYKGSVGKVDLLKELRCIFRKYDGYYDSDLFQQGPFLHPLDREDFLDIEIEVLANILDGLYHIPGVMADYDFSVIDADVLGPPTINALPGKSSQCRRFILKRNELRYAVMTALLPGAG
jgi:hypothetical protein